jgi:hypothetical protein
MHYYLFAKARLVRAEAAPAADQLALADRIYNGTVNLLAVGLVCSTNATIGAAVDAGNAVAESDIEYVILTDQWANMAAAGV